MKDQTTQDWRGKRIFEILDQLEPAQLGNGIDSSVNTILGKKYVVDELLAELKASKQEGRREVVKELEDLRQRADLILLLKAKFNL